MLLVLLCFMTLVGLMVAIKACCQLEFFQRNVSSVDSTSTESVFQVSVIESTSTNSIPVLYERNCQTNDAFIDIDFSQQPPSYEEAVKLPNKSIDSTCS